jgi:hypothetical protein
LLTQNELQGRISRRFAPFRTLLTLLSVALLESIACQSIAIHMKAANALKPSSATKMRLITVSIGESISLQSIEVATPYENQIINAHISNPAVA